MLSRAADAIYWMNRYIERAENVARFIDVNLHLMLDMPVGIGEQWEPLVRVTGDHHVFKERLGEATQENVVEFLTLTRPIPTPSSPACIRPGKTPAPCARSSRRRCGNRSTNFS